VANSGGGVQLNQNRLNLRSNTEWIQSNGTTVFYNAGSLYSFMASSAVNPFYVVQNINGVGMFAISRPSSSSHALVFGGDYFGSNYRSELTSNNTILGSGVHLNFQEIQVLQVVMVHLRLPI
jgi:hypothetical protein